MSSNTIEEFNEGLELLRQHVNRDGADTPAFSIYRLAEAHKHRRTAPPRESIPGDYGSDRFTIITSDPPRAHGASSRPYPTLTDEELTQAFKPPHETNAHLLLWNIQSTLPRAIGLIEAWGAIYRDMIIWQKRNTETGTDGGVSRWNLPNYNAEIVLHAHWESPISITIPHWIEAPVERREHSTKPSLFYRLLREASPDAMRIDQFARRQHVGFHAWGNEIKDGYQRWSPENKIT